MNERIDKLAEQAEDYSYAEYAKKQTGYTREDFFRAKFAELIVRECCQKLEDDGMVEVAMEMKQHFGVEE